MRILDVEPSLTTSFSGWYIPDSGILLAFGFGDHRAFFRKYFDKEPSKEMHGEAEKIISDMRKKLMTVLGGADYEDFYRHGWVRVNNEMGWLAISSDSPKVHSESVVPLLDKVKGWARKLKIELGDSFASDINPKEIGSASDLNKAFYDYKVRYGSIIVAVAVREAMIDLAVRKAVQEVVCENIQS